MPLPNLFFSLLLGPKDSNFAAESTLDPKGTLAVGYFHGGLTEWEENESSPRAACWGVEALQIDQ